MSRGNAIFERWSFPLLSHLFQSDLVRVEESRLGHHVLELFVFRPVESLALQSWSYAVRLVVMFKVRQVQLRRGTQLDANLAGPHHRIGLYLTSVP